MSFGMGQQNEINDLKKKSHGNKPVYLVGIQICSLGLANPSFGYPEFDCNPTLMKGGRGQEILSLRTEIHPPRHEPRDEPSNEALAS